jgi:hypothetical protein
LNRQDKYNRKAIYEAMGVEPRGLLIHNFAFDVSKRQLALSCFYDPDQNLPFEIRFINIRRFHWEVNDETSTPPADVISVFIGKPDYAESASILTDMYELQIEYQSLFFKKSW